MIANVIKYARKVMVTILHENVLKNVHKHRILLLMQKQNFVLQFAHLDFMQTIKREAVYLQLIVQMIWLVTRSRYNVLMPKIVQLVIISITIYFCV